MWRLVDEGAVGPVRVAYAEVNWSRIESWHPRPEPFYRIGPFADVGVYPLTILTAMFGPARRVTAFGKVVYADRVTTSGEPFSPGAPDFGVAVVELESGTVVRLTANFYVGRHSKQSGIELHGDTGSIFLSSWQEFDAAVELAPFGGAYEAIPVANPFPGTDWARARRAERRDRVRAAASCYGRTGRAHRRDPRCDREVGRRRSRRRDDVIVLSTQPYDG